MIFLIADTHTETKRLDRHIANIEKSISRKLDEHDMLVCLGDLFGTPARKASSLAKKIQRDRKFVEYVDALSFKVVCIHGNHDDAKRVWRIGARNSELFGQHAVQVGKNIYYLDNGGCYLLPIDAADEDIEGDAVSVLALGGSFGHLYRINGAEVMKELMFHKQYEHLMYPVNPIYVDYVLAHDAPTSRLGRLVKWAFGATPATNVFDRIEDNLIFYDWYYGHHHIDSDTTDWHHCLYKREVKLDVPDYAGRKPFNWRYLVEDASDVAVQENDEKTDNQDEDEGDDSIRSGSADETVEQEQKQEQEQEDTADATPDGAEDIEQNIDIAEQEDKKEPVMPSLTEAMIAASYAISAEDRMTSSTGAAIPHVPTDAEIELLVSCMKKDAEQDKPTDEKHK